LISVSAGKVILRIAKVRMPLLHEGWLNIQFGAFVASRPVEQ
jgi:hypothetical protein